MCASFLIAFVEEVIFGSLKTYSIFTDVTQSAFLKFNRHQNPMRQIEWLNRIADYGTKTGGV